MLYNRYIMLFMLYNRYITYITVICPSLSTLNKIVKNKFLVLESADNP